MDELVFRFLLDSGYPRASIVDEFEFLPIAGLGQDGAAPDKRSLPDYAILDPDTLERLAVFKAVSALDDAALRNAGTVLAQYAQRFGGALVQGFVVRIDPRARTEEDSVQFFRVRAAHAPERVATHAMPDLDTLRMRMRLSHLATLSAGIPDVPELDDDEFDLDGTPADDPRHDGGQVSRRTGVFIWLPGLVLAILALGDRFLEAPVVDVEQAVLLVGSAALFTWAALTPR